ncbi:hypothetical protein M5D96_004711, partial [Drosophila gunungcola]
PQPEQVEAIEKLIQQTYAVSISGDVANKKSLLPELVLEQMDEEQIWQQLEMRNELMLEQTAQLTAIREQHLGIELDDGEEQEEEDENQEAEESVDEEEEQESEFSDEDGDQTPKKGTAPKEKKNKRGRHSVLDEMNEFLEQEDAKEMRRLNSKRGVEQADDIDHYAEDFGLGEDEDGNVNYADFFDMDEELEQHARKINKGKQKDFFNENEDDNQNEEDEAEPAEDKEEVDSEIDESEFVAKSGIEPASDSDDSDSEKEEENEQAPVEPPSQSSNEMREARLFQRIHVVLGEKPWQLKGEVKAANRPQNSLLEEILDFDSTTRPTAPITEEDNRSIEDIIKQRIRDKAWDDVERTVRPVNTPQEYRKQLIYEAQYQREMEKLDPNRDADKSGPEPKEHQEIRRAMRSLFLKLDALSNFHFTPKPVAPEVKIVTNTPAVNMEEVAPLALLAPEEVFRGPKHAPLGKTERDRTDKNRERRKKKQKQRAINSALEQRDLQRAKEGKGPTKKEADAKLLKSITKNRNVQKKPQAKSLNKSNSIEGVAKKKGKTEKSKKLPKEATLELTSGKKIKNAASQKNDGVEKEQKLPKKESKAAKRPLILAPPESPAAPPAAEKKSKAKPAVPATPVPKKKPAKRPLILAPPESPVAPKTQEKKSAQEAAPAKKTVQAAPLAKKPAEVVPPATKSAQVAPPTKKPAKAAQPAKKAAQDAPPAKKAAQVAPPSKKPAQPAQAASPAKKSQKPAAEAPKKSEKPAKEATQAKPAKAQPAAQLQKKAKSVQKLSKAPKSKKPFNKKSKAGQAKGKSVKKAPSFDEQRYKEIVTENNVTKVCQALKTLVSEEVAKKKATSIFSDYRYILQVASYKISSCPKRMVKLSLKHSLVGNTDDVALIRGAKFESDPTKQHYEDLLREAGVKQRLTVIPFNQLRNEMGSFEAKRKFLNSYDYLLCDGRLSGQATAFLGKNTQKPRNVLHAVRLTKDKLPEEITRALSRTAFRQLAKGDLTSIAVGNDGHSAEQLAENILLVSKQLQQVFPGGLANIRSIMCAPPADTPYVVGPKEQRMLKLKKQANEVLSRFAMTKDADFIKLTSDQVKRKAELRVERAALLAADAAPKDNDGEDT